MSPGSANPCKIYHSKMTVSAIVSKKSANPCEIYQSIMTVSAIASKKNNLQGNGTGDRCFTNSVVYVMVSVTKNSLANTMIELEKLDESILGSEHSILDFVYKPYELLTRNFRPNVANILTEQDFCKNVFTGISRFYSSMRKTLENILEKSETLVKVYLSPGSHMSSTFLGQLSERLNLNMEHEHFLDNNFISQRTRNMIYENLIPLVLTFIRNTYYVFLSTAGLYKMFNSNVIDEALSNCASKIGLRWTSIHPYNCRYCLQVPVFTNGFIDRQDQKNISIALLSSTYDGIDGNVWVNNSNWKGRNINIWVSVR